jgi:hypothetical protein
MAVKAIEEAKRMSIDKKRAVLFILMLAIRLI